MNDDDDDYLISAEIPLNCLKLRDLVPLTPLFMEQIFIISQNLQC